mmetsp:Transcript_4284/g.18277  ORF Transcript_4284/g.18277 Transcript_4284/m.18277 type:complete len:102 (-) Transcript_4284:3073-3378(-)
MADKGLDGKEFLRDLALIVESETRKHSVEMTPKAILSLAEVVEAMLIERIAPDLEAFAEHGKRSTVTVDDVRLLARRSEDLANHLNSFLKNKDQKGDPGPS